MRRRLAIASVVGLVIAGLGLGVLLVIGGPLASPTEWTITFGVITGVFGIVLLAGREGFAGVLSATPTGAKISGSHVYDVELVVDQTRVPACRTRDRIRINRTDGALRGGEIISVARLRDDAPPWAAS